MKTLPKVSILLLLIGFCFASNIFSQHCPRYNRADYRHWIDADNDCQSTRNEVLIAESAVPVQFKTGDGCKVASGKWIDPYTGRTFTNPQQLDVDHVVPLKEAHESGAWKWPAEKKMRYANFLVDENHLIAVYKSANREKGAKDPAEWLPSNQAYLKDYARAWVKIKVNWGLTADHAELSALRKILAGEDITYPEEAPEYVCSGNSSVVPAPAAKTTEGGLVKKSRSGICYDPSSPNYGRTKRFEAFDSIQACLQSGGRLPKK